MRPRPEITPASQISHLVSRIQTHNRAQGRIHERADVQQKEVEEKLVAEAGRHSNLVAALRAAAIEHSLTGLRGHTYEKAVDLGATAAVGLERALGHNIYPVCKRCLQERNGESLLISNLAKLRPANKSCAADLNLTATARRFVHRFGELSGSQRPTCDSNTEYTEPEENEQRNSATTLPSRLPKFAFDTPSSILHNLWCNSNFSFAICFFQLVSSPLFAATIDSVP